MSKFRTSCTIGLVSLLLVVTACTGSSEQDDSGDGNGAPAARVLEDGAPLKVGLMFSSDAQETIKQAGGTSQAADRKVIHEALLAYVNDKGGIAGHPVEAAHYDFSSAATSQVISQGACTQWTQDDEVFAALPSASAQDNQVLRECLSKEGVVALYAGTYASTRQDQFADSPLWFEPNTLALEEWARIYVEGLSQQGFFEGAKVGVLYDQYPDFTAVA
jgi:hypothetical protein